VYEHPSWQSTSYNYENYLISEQVLRSSCRDKKIEGWRRYCSTLSLETRLTTHWKFASRGSGSWLPVFASRIAPDFVAPMFDLPEVGSSTFSWLAEPLSLDEL
jgi:hypothetical protein